MFAFSESNLKGINEFLYTFSYINNKLYDYSTSRYKKEDFFSRSNISEHNSTITANVNSIFYNKSCLFTLIEMHSNYFSYTKSFYVDNFKLCNAVIIHNPNRYYKKEEYYKTKRAFHKIVNNNLFIRSALLSLSYLKKPNNLDKYPYYSEVLKNCLGLKTDNDIIVYKGTDSSYSEFFHDEVDFTKSIEDICKILYNKIY